MVHFRLGCSNRVPAFLSSLQRPLTAFISINVNSWISRNVLGVSSAYKYSNICSRWAIVTPDPWICEYACLDVDLTPITALSSFSFSIHTDSSFFLSLGWQTSPPIYRSRQTPGGSAGLCRIRENVLYLVLAFFPSFSPAYSTQANSVNNNI